MIKANSRIAEKTLKYKYVTDLSDYKKLGALLRNRPMFDEHCIYSCICLRPEIAMLSSAYNL